MSWNTSILFFRKGIDDRSMAVELWPAKFEAPAEWSKRPSTPADPVEVQTGRRRMFPNCIRQNLEELLSITQYDYEPVPDFMNYVKDRIGSCRLGSIHPAISQAMKSAVLTEKEFMDSEACRFRLVRLGFRRRIARNGKVRKVKIGHVQALPSEERAAIWQRIHITRAHMQDLWEIWNERRGDQVAS